MCKYLHSSIRLVKFLMCMQAIENDEKQWNDDNLHTMMEYNDDNLFTFGAPALTVDVASSHT